MNVLISGEAALAGVLGSRPQLRPLGAKAVRMTSDADVAAAFDNCVDVVERQVGTVAEADELVRQAWRNDRIGRLLLIVLNPNASASVATDAARMLEDLLAGDNRETTRRIAQIVRGASPTGLRDDIDWRQFPETRGVLTGPHFDRPPEGMGSSVVVGGPSADTLVGGAGDDTFAFNTDDGRYRIADEEYYRGGATTPEGVVAANHIWFSHSDADHRYFTLQTSPLTVEERVRAAGLRMTETRRRIAHALDSILGGRASPHIYQLVRDVDPTIRAATVVRTVRLFQEVGVLFPNPVADLTAGPVALQSVPAPPPVLGLVTQRSTGKVYSVVPTAGGWELREAKGDPGVVSVVNVVQQDQPPPSDATAVDAPSLLREWFVPPASDR